MVESGDVEGVRATIKSTYGFDVTETYARDLLAFVEKMTK